MAARIPFGTVAAAWALAGVLSSHAHAEALLRWLPPADPDLEGYVVYLSDGRKPFEPGPELGRVPPDPASGVASYDLGALLPAGEYTVAMTAYDLAGNESELSNSVVVRVEESVGGCLGDSECDDGDLCNGPERCVSGRCVPGVAPACTAGACRQGYCDSRRGCLERALPDSTRCDDGDPSTWDDLCTEGACRGVQCRSDADCDDRDACNGVERCTAGLCRAEVPVLAACPAAPEGGGVVSPGPREGEASSTDGSIVLTERRGEHRVVFIGDLPEDASILRAWARSARAFAPTIVLGGGSYGPAAPQAGVRRWIEEIAPLSRRAIFLPAVGGRPDDLALFSGSLEDSRGDGAGIYGFDLGSTHYLAVDAAEASTLDPATPEGRAQLDRIERDLAEAAGRPAVRWTIVYMHLDLYSSIGDVASRALRAGAARAALAAIFERHGVDLVLSSGSPGYERSHPLVAGRAIPAAGRKVAAGLGVIYVRASASASDLEASSSSEAAPEWSAQRAGAPSFVGVRDRGSRGLVVDAFAYDPDRARRIDRVRIRPAPESKDGRKARSEVEG